ncbi:MAG: ribonuclease D, partial [Alphaproteobacteria bacterium]
MTLISTSAALADICKSLSRADYLTVDTEFMRESTFWPQLCLLQIAGPDDAFAVDPLAEGMDLTPVLELLADTSIVKVMHAARQDMEI